MPFFSLVQAGGGVFRLFQGQVAGGDLGVPGVGKVFDLPFLAAQVQPDIFHLQFRHFQVGEESREAAPALLAEGRDFPPPVPGFGQGPGREHQVQFPQFSPQGLVAGRLGRGPGDLVELLFGFGLDDPHVFKVVGGRQELALGLFLLLFIAGDAGGFVDEAAALFRPGVHQPAYAALLDDAVGPGAHALVGEEADDVLEPAGRAVD